MQKQATRRLLILVPPLTPRGVPLGTPVRQAQRMRCETPGIPLRRLQAA